MGKKAKNAISKSRTIDSLKWGAVLNHLASFALL
jgi:hypothetical protein